MGGLSVYNDSIHMNFKNPASYTGKNMFSFNNEGRLVKFTVGLGHTETDLKTSSSNSETANTSFEYLGLNIPMGKFGLGFGLIPYSSVGYKLESLNQENEIQFQYTGKGGLNKTFLGFAYQLSKNIAIGFDTRYNFGNIQNSALEYLYDEESLPLDYHAREQNRSDLSGINYNFGITYIGNLNENLDKKNENISKFTNSLISKINQNIENFRYNVIIANFYEMYNFLSKELKKPADRNTLILNYSKIYFFINFLKYLALIKLNGLIQILEQLSLPDIHYTNLELSAGFRVHHKMMQATPRTLKLLKVCVMHYCR